MDLNQEIVAAIVAGIGTIATALVAGIRMLFKRLDKYLAELVPNGGGSIKDQVTRLEENHKILDKKIDQNHKDVSARIDDVFKILTNNK